MTVPKRINENLNFKAKNLLLEILSVYFTHLSTSIEPLVRVIAFNHSQKGSIPLGVQWRSTQQVLTQKIDLDFERLQI